MARPAVCPRLRNGFELDASRSVVWGKASAGAGNLYRAQHELLPLFKSEINNDPRLPLVAHFGPHAMSDLSPLSGVERKLDFGAVRSVFADIGQHFMLQ